MADSSGGGRGEHCRHHLLLIFFFVSIPLSTIDAWQNDARNYLDDDIGDDWVDYRDMMNYDMGSKTMKRDTVVDESPEKDGSSCPPCVCQNDDQADTTSNKPQIASNDNEDKSGQSADKACPSSTSSNDTCQAESEMSLVCVSTLRKLMRFIVDASGALAGVKDDEEEEDVEFHALFRLPVEHIKVLRRVTSDKKVGDDSQDAAGACRDVVWAMQHLSASMVKVQRGSKDGGLLEMEEEAFISMDNLRGNAHLLLWGVSIFAGFFGLWVFRRIFHMSIGMRDFVKVILMFYIALFIVSIPWNWMALYQQAQSRQKALLTQKIPAECASAFPDFDGRQTSIFETFSQTFSTVLNAANIFAFKRSEDVCQKYHDAFYVDVMAEVSPMKALSATINQMALEPLEYLGQALGKFIHGTFSELPWFMWPVALALVVILVLVARGYHLGLGFGLISIAPSNNGSNASDPSLAIGGYPDSARPSIAQDVASQLIHRLNEENLSLRHELADTRGRLLLRLDADGKSKPLYTSPFKDPEPLALEAGGRVSPTRGRTVRSHSAPDLKRFHFHSAPPPKPAEPLSSTACHTSSSLSSASSSSSHKLPTPSSSRRGTLVPISEENAEDVAISPDAASANKTLLGSVVAEPEIPAVMPKEWMPPSPNGAAAQIAHTEVENGFVMIEEECPENMDMEACVNVPRQNGNEAQPSSIRDAGLSATEPMDDDFSSKPLDKLPSTLAPADLKNSTPSSVSTLVADASTNLCNLSLDE